MFGKYNPGTLGYLLNVISEYVPAQIACCVAVDTLNQEIHYGHDKFADYTVDGNGWPTFFFVNDAYNKNQELRLEQAQAIHAAPRSKVICSSIRNLEAKVINLRSWLSYADFTAYLIDNNILSPRAISNIGLSFAFHTVHTALTDKSVLVALPDIDEGIICSRKFAEKITYAKLDHPELTRCQIEPLIESVLYEEHNKLVVCRVTVKTNRDTFTVVASDLINTSQKDSEVVAYEDCLRQIKARVQLEKAVEARNAE